MHLTAEYLELNRSKHREKAQWGTRGHLRAQQFEHLFGESILDYGCGKGLVSQHYKNVTSYDPAVPGKDTVPTGKFDTVLCLDVLEHVEPEFVGEVLAQLRSYCTRLTCITVSCRRARNFLPDGSNSHRTVHPARWWRDRLQEHFRLVERLRHPAYTQAAFVCYV